MRTKGHKLLVMGAIAAALVLLTTIDIQAQVFHTAVKSHPLPSFLAQWDSSSTGQSNYFKQIKPMPLGYLIWSELPVSVYIGPSNLSNVAMRQSWEQQTQLAIADWQQYFPLIVTDTPEADILIEQVRPRKTSNGRARSAQATPEVYCARHALAHRFTIQISPSQVGPYIRSATRHELGHALGLWGHSQNSADVMYAAQSAQPPIISARDVNTLKKIYEQPTLLGWSAPKYCPNHS